MRLIIKEKLMNTKSFNEASNRIRDKVQDIYGSNFSCWYNPLVKVAQFKINEKYRNIVEAILLDY